MQVGRLFAQGFLPRITGCPVETFIGFQNYAIGQSGQVDGVGRQVKDLGEFLLLLLDVPKQTFVEHQCQAVGQENQECLIADERQNVDGAGLKKIGGMQGVDQTIDHANDADEAFQAEDKTDSQRQRAQVGAHAVQCAPGGLRCENQHTGGEIENSRRQIRLDEGKINLNERQQDQDDVIGKLAFFFSDKLQKAKDSLK